MPVKVIPASIRNSGAFQQDVKNLLSAPRDLLSAFGKEDGTLAERLSDSEIEELARRHDMDVVAVQGMYMVLEFLRGYIKQSDEADPEDVLRELTEVLNEEPIDITEKEECIRRLLAISEEERVEALSVKALDFGSAYTSCEVKPVFVPVSETDDRLVAGFLLNVEYVSSERDKMSVTFSMTRGEIEQLVQKISNAKRASDRLGATLIADRGHHD